MAATTNIIVKRILAPIDFSETSAYVLGFARMLADSCGASLHLLHVINRPLASPDAVHQERDEACRRLHGLLDAADRERRGVTTSCELGTPADAIVGYTRAHAVDLIVMGTHSHGPTFRMVTGSIAESVLRSAPCAVAAVKGPERIMYECAVDPAPARAAV